MKSGSHILPLKSATVTWQGWLGIVGFACALGLQKYFVWPTAAALLLVLVLTASPILFCEGRRVLRCRQWHRPDIRRVAIKLGALLQTWAVIAAAYWAIPFYFYGPGGLLLNIVTRLYVWLPLAVLIPLYIALEDASTDAPEDALYHIGCMLFGLGPSLPRQELIEYVMGWAIKAFFLPIMLSGAVDDIRWWTGLTGSGDYFWYFELIYSLLFFVDVTYALVGYLCTFKLFDTHIRSSQPRTIGWLVALICYPPFWNGLADPIFRYNPDGREWGDFLRPLPVLPYVWAAIILLLAAIYVAATVQFGVRFSNLTHRGILTNGPYRWFKHPAYLAKNITWWMLAVPFLPHAGYPQALRSCLLLLALNGVYYMRAKTEEWHLVEDPAYRAYMAFIDQQGAWAVLRRKLNPLLARRSHPA